MAGSLGNALLGKISIGTVDLSKGCIGSVLIYSAGNMATYYVDTDIVYQEEVDEGETVLLPKTFIPSKDDWEFVGWRKDTEANGDVLEELVMDDSPITLYAIFKQTITLSYNGNGGIGTTASQDGIRYYNGYGTYLDPTFTIRSNNFSLSGYSFVQWRLNGTSGTAYGANSTIILSENAVLYAEWKYAGAPFTWINEGNPVSPYTLSWTQVSKTGNGNFSMGAGVGQPKGTISMWCGSEGLTQSRGVARSNAINKLTNKTMQLTVKFNHNGSSGPTNIVNVKNQNGVIIGSKSANADQHVFTVNVESATSVYLEVDVTSYSWSTADVAIANVRFY